MTLRAVNPTTHEVIKDYPTMSPQAVQDAIEKSHAAFLRWKMASFATRAAPLRRAAQILRHRAPALARLMAEEMGKPVSEGRAEAEKCAWACEFYADKAESFLQPRAVEIDQVKRYVCYPPLGVLLAVMPWNYPFWQVFRCAAPALMAGNTVLLKHASNVPGCALAIEQVLKEAGLPDHAFKTLLIGSAEVSPVITHPRVRAVSLTGSTAAGKAVAALAGAHIKKTVLELGGSDPYILLAGADLELAVPICAQARLANAGQSCVAAKRFIVVKPLLKKFEAMLVDALRAVNVGNPLEPETRVGPMARADLRDDLHRQVEASVRKGARCLLGGKIPEGIGAFYPPTVLTDVGPGMPAYDEELFGPVAAIIAARDDADAVRIANDTCFGLGAAVFTRDTARGEAIAAGELEAGVCFVNGQVKSDPRLPFGGIKASGYGRELSEEGLREFVNIKTVCVVSAVPAPASAERLGD